VLADVQLLLDADADAALEGVSSIEGDEDEPLTVQNFPLGAAASGGHIEVVRLLLGQDGVDPHQLTTDTGCSAFFFACASTY
jgi:hypothetical protein